MAFCCNDICFILITDKAKNLQYLIRCSWAKLSNRCFRALFSMLRIRLCWLRNSSSAETPEPSACNHKKIGHYVFLSIKYNLVHLIQIHLKVSPVNYVDTCLESLYIPFQLSYVLKLPDPRTLSKLPALK